MLSVTSASLSPFPSPQRMFSRGTRTLLKPMTPFSMALSPMKRHRCTISTPGNDASTMNAVICLRFLPVASITSGVRAITTYRSARVPFVHHSFWPLRMKCFPSSVGVADVDMFAGSEPASTSVSANAEIAPRARRGKYLRFCSSVPNSFSGCGTPIDWLADNNATREPSLRRDHLHRADVRQLRESEPTVFRRDLDPERSHVAKLLHVGLWDLAAAIDLLGWEALEERAQGIEERFRSRGLGWVVHRGMRVDQIEAKAAEEQLASEARVLPLGLARRFGDVACFLLRGDVRCVGCHFTSLACGTATPPHSAR